MADLPSSFSTVNDVEGAQDSLVAESQYIKLGSNDNYLKDGLDAEIATRTSADSALTTEKNTIKTELNQLILFPKRVHIGSIYYPPLFIPTSTVLFSNIGSNQRLCVVWAEKRTGTNQTWIKIQLFLDGNDRMGIDHAFQVSGLFTTQWDTFHWYNDLDTSTIHYRFYNNNTMSIP